MFQRKAKEKNISHFEASECILEEKFKRIYHNIPLYTEREMENAVIEEAAYGLNDSLYRQALNGYAGVYNEKWVVGKNEKGILIKREKVLLTDSDGKIQNYIRKIMEVQKKAVYGKDLQEEKFCKFTYDIVNQDEFSIHTSLVKEYVKDCVMEDEVYYEYMENTFVGKKVFVSDVMYLNDCETWNKLNGMTDSIKKNKGQICSYLKELQDKLKDDYNESINYISEL